MKRSFLHTLFLLIVVLMPMSVINAEPIDPYSLPDKAQTFLRKTFFYTMPISTERTDAGFEVVMADNSIVQLDRKGNWTDIVCLEGVPDMVLPLKLRVYMMRRFEGQPIVHIAHSSAGYMLELSNGMTLWFDGELNLIKVG